MALGPNPLTRVAVEQRTARALRRFPELSAISNADYAALAGYADSSPERFLNLRAKDDALSLLRAEAADPNGLLGAFLQDHRSELDLAFRALSEVNRLPGHDEPWPGFDDLAQLDLIDREINPSYLKLAEAVLATFLLPIAVRERRMRGRATSDIPLHQRIEEALRTPLAGHLGAFDRVLRNAIAHGRVSYRQHEIVYQDSNASRVLSPRDMAESLDSLLDTCNGLAAAYRCLFLLEQGFMTAHSVSPPLQMVLEEVRAQTGSPSWSIAGALEYASPASGRQLNVIVRNRFFDESKVLYFCVATGAIAERFIPGFDRYFLAVRGRTLGGGWAAFDGTKLEALRVAGNSDLAQAATAIASPGFGIFPSRLSRVLRVCRPLRMIGSLVEFSRIRWTLSRQAGWTLAGIRVHPRHVKIHRKQAYAAVDAQVVLDTVSAEDAVRCVRSHARVLVLIASLSARLRRAWRSSAVILPVGYCSVNVYLSDFRLRRLEGYGLGSALLCRITFKRFGRVRTIPILTSIPEDVHGCRIDWNSNAVNRTQLGL